MRQLRVVGLVFWIAGCGGSSVSGDGGFNDLVADAPDVVADSGPVCRVAADCTALDPGPCGRVACSAAGVCEIRADAGREGLTCDPGDLCAVGGATCRSGACVPAGRKTCLERACLSGRCDEASGECRYESLPDGQACEGDGNSCTPDQCVGGSCQAGPNGCQCGKDSDCPAPADKCMADLRCDLGSSRCVPAAEGPRCSQPADPCRVASCDAATGDCVQRSLPDQTECDPSTVCHGVGTCLAGICQRPVRCADDDPCTNDLCDPTSGACTFAPSTGGSCSDGDPCTVDDVCAGGACAPGTARDCDDGNPCTQDACVPGQGCTWTPLAPTTPCDDGLRCTTDDVCGVAGICAGTPRMCDDGNVCTRDACDGATGSCVAELLSDIPCDDGHACTVGDACRTGLCVPGAWVRACCEADADCDDGDACTFEQCSGGTCSWADEPANLCAPQAPYTGCGASWCRAADGGCEALDLRMPRRLVAWDLRVGGATPGFRWSGGSGERRAEGAGPVSGSAGASFRLPARRMPAGLAVLVLDLGASACGAVDLYREGTAVPAAECGVVDGRTRAAWSWPVTGAPLDLTVRMEAEAVVAKVDLYLWALGTCLPLGPLLVAEGVGYSELAMNSGPGGISASYLQNDAVKVIAYSADTGVGTTQSVSHEPVLVQAPYFAISLVATPDRGLALAYGGSKEKVVVVHLKNDGSPLTRVVLPPTVPSDGEKWFEPSIVRTPSGTSWMAWSASEGGSTDFNLGINEFSLQNNTPTFPTPGVLLNTDTAGIQRRPRLAAVGSTGVAAWISEQSGPLNRVILRRLDADGTPIGDEVVVDEGTDAIRDIGLAPVGPDRVAWVVERDGGVLRGGIRSAADLSRIQDTAFPSETIARRYSPDLAVLGDRALLASAGFAGTLGFVTLATLDGQGVLGPEVTVSPRVEKSSASPAVAGLDPYWAMVAWYDGTDERPSGVYLALTAPTCIHGAIDCTDYAAPAVCVGFGPTGYVPLPGATTWCQ